MEEDAEGMDRLDMDGDFLGGRSGRDGEFYYEGCRQRVLQTRDDALYGVFAEGHSDYDYEEDEGSRRRKRRRDESESDFTRPVQFVSKGMPEGVEQKEQRTGLGQVASSLRTAAAEDDQQERVASLVREKEKVAKQDALQKHQLQVMETIAGVLEQVWVEDTAGLLMLRGLLKTFQELKLRHEEEFKMCSVAWIACRFAHPLLIRVFQGWQPLQNPLFGLEVMSSWKYLLQCDQPYDFSDATESMAPYVQLVSEVIMPAVRISGTNSWEARDPEPMLCFLKSWERLLPPVVLHSILEHVIMPKLTAAVESWDPRREKVPIHVWVHPWLPTLGRRIETLCDSIRYKLSQRRRTKKN